jgi:hypothetical protein
LPVVDLDDIGDDDQFEKSGESINTKITAKGLHDQINFDTSRKDVGDS